MSDIVETRGKTTQLQGANAQSTTAITRGGIKSLKSRRELFEIASGSGLEEKASLSARRSVPAGLSFLAQGSFGSYPDTAESGETYDMEATFRLKSPPRVAPIGEYSE